MLKFYIEDVDQHPLTGEPITKIIEVVADVPELEKELGGYRRVLDIKALAEGVGER